MDKTIFKREYDIGEILEKAWELFTKNFKTILIISLFVYIPINIILGFFPVNTSEGLEGYARYVQLLEIVIGIIATIAIAFVVNAKIKGKKIDYLDALSKAIEKYPVALGTTIMMAIFLIGLFILLIIPGIIFSVYWGFALYAIIFHNKSWMSALRYSKSIVKGRWWKVFGYTIVFSLLAVALAMAVGLVLGILSVFLPGGYIMGVVLATVIDIVLTYFTVVYVVFFINMDATAKKH